MNRIAAGLAAAAAVLVGGSAFSDPRGPASLDFLVRFHHRELTQETTTGPEMVERVTIHRLVFGARTRSSVRLAMFRELTMANGWNVHVVLPRKYIVFDWRDVHASYMSARTYRRMSADTDHPLARVLSTGCVVEYYIDGPSK